MQTNHVDETWETEPKHKSRKNTKRWCKGKQGREHRFEWVDDKEFRDVRVYKCASCGKTADRCWGNMFSFESGVKGDLRECHCGGPHWKRNQ